MMKQIHMAAGAAVVLWSGMALAQTQPAKSVVGTVSLFKAETAEIEIKPDNGAPVALKITADTMEPGTSNLRRIVVMSATDIVKKNEADRLDWTKRGVSGMVASKSGNEVTLKIRTLGGESQAVVTVTEKTSFKRYAPDSVKFAEAGNSKLAEISVGDQVRARGVKSEDGLKVTAEDVVFGTFVTKAGTITAVNPETREVTVRDLSTNKAMAIRITADSQIKKMPDMAAMMGGMAGMGRGGAPAGAGRSGGGAGMGGGMRGMDINAMLERMPLAKLEDLKAGETIVVSSTKGAKSNEVTAIMMLANADSILQMMAAQTGGGRGAGIPGAGGMGGMGGGGMDALGGMGLGGIMP
jgi:hypothetical protein